VGKTKGSLEVMEYCINLILSHFTLSIKPTEEKKFTCHLNFVGEREGD
jgi:hypothetical protein